jgi:hypothetical protein
MGRREHCAMHIIDAAILAARFDDLLKILPIFLFLIFWVMGQIAEAKKRARMAKPGPVPGTMPAATSAAGGGENKAAPTDPLRQQVDDFLRRAERQTATVPTQATVGTATPSATRPSPADRDRIEILLPSASTRPPQSPPQRPAAAAGPAPPPRTQNPTRPPQAPKRRSQTVAEHVAEHVTSAAKQIGDEASRLGERVASVDKQFGAQLQKFDHEIGTFGDRRGALAQAPQRAAEVVNPALEIAAMLSGGDGMRRAVILNEIFRRPEERWQ